MDLKGKTAVITGGAKGIGRAVSLKLGKLGANIVINYSGSQDAAREITDELNSMGVKAISLRADVSDAIQVNEMFETVNSTFGSIDILVCNAGIARDTLIMRMSEEDFDRVINVNLKGTFNCIKAASKYMVKQRYGRIVNMASIVGITGNAGQANYAASKAGIIGLTKSAAKELSVRNINVNAVAPGFISTDMTETLPDKIKTEYMDKIPLKRCGTPEDVAECVAFLCSDVSSYITGQVINVDGGMVM